MTTKTEELDLTPSSIVSPSCLVQHPSHVMGRLQPGHCKQNCEDHWTEAQMYQNLCQKFEILHRELDSVNSQVSELSKLRLTNYKKSVYFQDFSTKGEMYAKTPLFSRRMKETNSCELRQSLHDPTPFDPHPHSLKISESPYPMSFTLDAQNPRSKKTRDLSEYEDTISKQGMINIKSMQQFKDGFKF